MEILYIYNYIYTYVHVCKYNVTYICASPSVYVQWAEIKDCSSLSTTNLSQTCEAIRPWLYCQILSAPLRNDQTKHLCCYKTAVRNCFFTSVTNTWEITWRSKNSQAIPGRITNNPKQKGEQPTNLTTHSTTWVCLKIGYIPNYSHLIGIMIINHWV